MNYAEIRKIAEDNEKGDDYKVLYYAFYKREPFNEKATINRPPTPVIPRKRKSAVSLEFLNSEGFLTGKEARNFYCVGVFQDYDSALKYYLECLDYACERWEHAMKMKKAQYENFKSQVVNLKRKALKR